MALKESPSQTAGPYVHIGCTPQTAGLEQRSMGAQLGGEVAQEEAITLDITVLDGAGDPVRDALIEIWQAGSEGRAGHWGRQAADLETGLAHFTACKPGAAEGQTPHILVWIVARGINLGLTTRVYFPDENNTSDPVFGLAGDRAETMVAERTNAGYAHVIHLQGPEETVFFDV
ncbi:MAG: protocatechuate 3,4-dioxygenase subunit alpha [Pseudomonadota bacterium]